MIYEDSKSVEFAKDNNICLGKEVLGLIYKEQQETYTVKDQYTLGNEKIKNMHSLYNSV